MGEDDLTAQRARLEREAEDCKRHQLQFDEGTTRLQKLQAQIYDREVKLRMQNQEAENTRAALRSELRELEEKNALLELGAEHDDYISRLKSGQDADSQPVRVALQRRRKQITDTLSALQKLERANETYDAACQALDEAHTAESKARVTLGDAQAQEQEERDRLIEAFARRQSLNEELLCSEEEFLTLRQAVARYRSPADWSAIREQLDRCAQHKRTGLQDTALRLQSERNVLQKEYDALDRIRRQILSNPEPVPPRRPQIEATRIQLTMQGIHHAPFYETVDFSPELSPAAI